MRLCVCVCVCLCVECVLSVSLARYRVRYSDLAFAILRAGLFFGDNTKKNVWASNLFFVFGFYYSFLLIDILGTPKRSYTLRGGHFFVSFSTLRARGMTHVRAHARSP